MLDIVIIGSGPAGLSAAIYGSRSGLDVLVIEKISHGIGQIAEADCINNYLGFSSIRGFELGMQFRTHAEACGVRFQESEAIKLEQTDACWKIYAKDGSCIQSKTVIYAAGASHRHLNVFGEEALIGKGVSYCATCDGTFYKGKDVAVIGGGNTVALAQQVIGVDKDRIEKNVRGMLQLVGLQDRADVYPRELSGGEQQRVAIARAMVNRPSVLLADEPTGNLDPQNSWDIMALLEDMNRLGTTVMVVTHNNEIVNQMQKRVVTLHEGVIISDQIQGGYVQ